MEENKERHATYVLETLSRLCSFSNEGKQCLQLCNVMMNEYIEGLDSSLDSDFQIPLELRVINTLLEKIDDLLTDVDMYSQDCMKDFHIAMQK